MLKPHSFQYGIIEKIIGINTSSCIISYLKVFLVYYMKIKLLTQFCDMFLVKVIIFVLTSEFKLINKNTVNVSKNLSYLLFKYCDM